MRTCRPAGTRPSRPASTVTSSACLYRSPLAPLFRVRVAPPGGQRSNQKTHLEQECCPRRRTHRWGQRNPEGWGHWKPEQTQCTYGGMAPNSGYWLADEDCPLNHGSTCAWCPTEATTGFAGWGDDSWSLWQVPACEEHGAAWAAGHPEWRRDTESKPEPTWQELLDGLNPFARALAEDYRRAMDDALLFGNGPRPGDPQTGIGGLMGGVVGAELLAVVMPYPKAAPPGPPRVRFNQDTKAWEAQ